MPAFQEIRDPVHGFIPLTHEESKIVNTSILQRLRGIKQLAMASLVYPGAIHTRFDHTLGVTHVAGLLSDRLLQPDARRLIRLTALLHDVGHGPFSHVSEDTLDQFSDFGHLSHIKEKIHEQVTARIIETNGRLAEIIGKDTCTDVINMLAGGSVESVDRGIVSGPLDADKQDYLLRDSYFCGVKYGIYDLPRLIDSLSVQESGTERILAATAGGVPAIEQFVMAKYHMTAQVYRHKVRLITDSMIVRALQLGIEVDGLEWLRKLYRYDGSADFIDNYLQWDDARLTTALLYPLDGKGGLATNLFLRLSERRLFKRVFSRNLRDFSEPVFRERFPKLFKVHKQRAQLEREIGSYLSEVAGEKIRPEYVVVHYYSLKSARVQSRNNEGSIVILEQGQTKTFEDASTLFRSIDDRENDEFVEVYAPYPFKTKVNQRRLEPKFADDIAAILQKPFHAQLEH